MTATCAACGNEVADDEVDTDGFCPPCARRIDEQRWAEVEYAAENPR